MTQNILVVVIEISFFSDIIITDTYTQIHVVEKSKCTHTLPQNYFIVSIYCFILFTVNMIKHINTNIEHLY